MENVNTSASMLVTHIAIFPQGYTSNTTPQPKAPHSHLPSSNMHICSCANLGQIRRIGDVRALCHKIGHNGDCLEFCHVSTSIRTGKYRESNNTDVFNVHEVADFMPRFHLPSDFRTPSFVQGSKASGTNIIHSGVCQHRRYIASPCSNSTSSSLLLAVYGI